MKDRKIWVVLDPESLEFHLLELRSRLLYAVRGAHNHGLGIKSQFVLEEDKPIGGGFGGCLDQANWTGH